MYDMWNERTAQWFVKQETNCLLVISLLLQTVLYKYTQLITHQVPHKQLLVTDQRTLQKHHLTFTWYFYEPEQTREFWGILSSTE